MAAIPELIFDARAFSWRAHLPQLRDPGLASLRRAARAALLVPALFAICSWAFRPPQPQLITFATFGAFALLVLGDFGGSSRPRAGAYAVTTAVGCLIITCGTLGSATPWTAALVVGLVGFIVQFLGVFGGYVTAAQLPLVLSLVLAVAIPAPADQIPQRLAGWLLGGTVALLGGVYLWPRHEHATLRQSAAATCTALGDLVAALYGLPRGAQASVGVATAQATLDGLRQRADLALGDLRQAFRVTPHRPASPTRDDRAFAMLVDELGRELQLLPRAAPPPPNAPAGGISSAAPPPPNAPARGISSAAPQPPNAPARGMSSA